MKWARWIAAALILTAPVLPVALQAQYVNFESSQVHPVALTPSGGRLLVVNTPDALLEVFTVQTDGSSIVDLNQRSTTRTLPVGDEPTDVVFAVGRAFVAVARPLT